MSSDTIDILCIGSGALGTVYGHILERGGARITAVARSNYESMSRDGITINSPIVGRVEGWKPYKVVRGPEEVQDQFFDYVVCTFKCTPDLTPTSEIIRPFLRKPSNDEERSRLPTIVTVQNGIGIEAEVRTSLVDCAEPVAKGIISAVAWIGANLKENGTVVEYGSLEKLEMGVFASLDAPTTDNGIRIPSDQEQASLDHFFGLYKRGGGGGLLSDDIEAVRWKKVLWNAGWGGLCSLARQPVAAMITESTLHHTVGVVRRTMLEILFVARACGIGEDRFPAAAVDAAFEITGNSAHVAQFADIQSNLSGDFKPSILLDLENGRPMELYPIIGAVVEKARLHNVDTPRLDMILAALWPSQVEAITRARGGKDKAGQVGVQYSSLNAVSKGAWSAGAPVPRDGRNLI
ncbi:uncharacterized protein PFL1_00386 [Pseudozyma flocculosa PF-1]|uniref:2-dehydropantoate 2-reductase n=1 Tax=Pseudozyma flocculosa TaxID=84751 RepID=A0A5C3ETK8_9BASI|nr:uncharacterized protein PFL1_00386 [Pseudozyma flocculosa PF-1]EPQ32189.1 hypothetical protein PFL1_00386 [Pseudozyma flocculosa PF-1]SPO34866.1 uncharacterized protein PSFLO_00337 [Pseudozyma flocculosa]